MESPLGVRKGAWTGEEDLLLRKCIEKYGEGEWHQIPIRAGLNRCRKSCRLRWLNYLRPNIKRGEFTLDEVDLMMRLHKLLGNRWSLIAGRLPGRTANDVKNYWNSHIHKKSFSHQQEMKNETQKRLLQVNDIIKPRPRTFGKSLPLLRDKFSSIVDNNKLKENICKPSPTPSTLQLDGNQWWESSNVDHASYNVATSFASGIEEEPIASLSWAEEIAPMTGVGETFMEDGQSGWSDFSFDMDIWDLL